jgi:hypothetical protein
MISHIVPAVQPCLVPDTQFETPDVEMRDGDILVPDTLEEETNNVSGFVISAFRIKLTDYRWTWTLFRSFSLHLRQMPLSSPPYPISHGSPTTLTSPLF